VLRVLHFSDVHVDVPLWRLPWRDMLGKRLVGGANLVLRRHRHFREARPKLRQLARFAQRERIDLVVCTGDYTALGTAPELQAAREAVQALTTRPLGYVTVPGNHDLYLPDAVDDRRFERAFGDLLSAGHWPERAVDGIYPAVHLYGDALAVVTINSARPNPPILRSSGRIPEAQLQTLASILDEPELQPRSVLVATHYAPRLRDGSPDHFRHGLENADALLEVCRRKTPRLAVLHGHTHWRYHLGPASGLPHIFGAGSATYAGREGIWVFEVQPDGLRALPGAYRDGNYVLESEQAVEL
jgi:3',5'-cyclic AMP phosphodiesterase CpdA